MSAGFRDATPLRRELEALCDDARRLRQTLAAQADTGGGAGSAAVLAIGRLDASVIRPLSEVTSAEPAPDLPDAETQVVGERADVDGSLWSLAKRATRLRLRPGSPTQLHEATAALQDLACRSAVVDGSAAVDARLQELRDMQAQLPCGIQGSTDGPYLVTNAENLRSWLGDALPSRPQLALCRCGASALKPLCDGSHARVGFSGAKDPNRIPDRRDRYVGQQVTILDNRGTCQHSGFCTDRLATAFRLGEEPFVLPSGGRMDELIRAVRDCPSGALSYAIDDVEAREDVDFHAKREATIEVSKDGPYRITGGIALTDGTGAKAVATKQVAIHASPTSGTQEQTIEAERQEQPALTDTQVVRLAQLGRRVEAHFGRPQDIEWCLADDGFFEIVQSRPITTLFPIPAAGDGENHVYVSVGHQQMMTDPMKPLGLSLHQLLALPRMYEAGGRLFVDVAERLASPSSRARVLEALGRSDPLIGDALQTILDRGDFIPSIPDDGAGGPPPGGAPAPIEIDPAIVAELIERTQASIAASKRDIATKSATALFDFILTDIQELKQILFDPRSHQVLMGAMEATWWLNEQLQAWLGEKNAADTLTQSAPGNITSEMGLALLDVADVIRPHPEVVAFLEGVEDEDFLEQLAELAGGPEVRDSIEGYLDRYGMRCVGEIDITRPRWRERPSTLVRLLVGNIKNFERGAGQRRFEQGRQEASEKEQELLERLRALPGGEQKAEEAKRMIDRVRTFIGYREYPKYGIVSRYFVYKQALLKEAERLARADVLAEKEDIFYLTFQELANVVRTNEVDDQLISQRKHAFKSYQALTPPRVLTSEGEVIAGSYRRDDVPTGALIGLPVSGGTVEGRARVILDMTEADLEAGDILVTAYTDPSWSPLFVAIKGLVTEVGGLMTHGAVIAREYGLPAVVGVQQATRLIRDGQRIRVHGTDGYVEVLP